MKFTKNSVKTSEAVNMLHN